MLVMLMFVLVSVVAAQGRLEHPGRRAGRWPLVAVRALAKITGVALANWGSGIELSPGILDRMRDVAYVVRGIAAGIAVRRVVA
jgi:hypothetical protein